MSKVQVDTIVDKDDISAPTLSKGAIVTGVCTATTFVGAVTGDVTGNADTATTATTATSATTATTATNAQGLTGTPNITVGNVTSANVTNSKQTTSEHVNITGVGTFGSDISVADNIVHTGNTNTAIKFASNSITLDSAGSLALHIDGSAKIGINTNDPQKQLDVFDPTAGTIRVSQESKSADFICNATGGLLRTIGSYPLVLNTNQTDRLRIGTSGEIGLAVASGVSTDYGTSGQVLTSAGSGSAVSWTTPAGGGWVPLDSTTTTWEDTYAYESTNILSNNTSYQQFRIEFYIRMQGIGKVHLYQYDSGAWQADGSNYVWENRVANGNSNAWTHTTSSGAGEIPIANNNMYVHQGSVTIWNPNLTTVQATWISECKGWYGFQNWSPSYDVSNQNMDYCTTIAEREIGSGSPVAVDGFRLKPSANISGCYVTVYGLKTA